MKRAAAALAVLLLAVVAIAGPEWVEPKDEDAGSVPGAAQPTNGLVPLNFIRGRISGIAAAAGSGPVDLDDMYIICIDDAAAFLASTVTAQGGMSLGFDPRLYLYSLEGQGLLGNDNTPDVAAGPGFLIDPTLVNTSDDGTNVIVDLSGLYLLAITAAPREPLSNGGSIFFFASSTEVSGPDGPGGGEEIMEWQPGSPVTGACCLSSGNALGSCIETDLESCQAIEGLYLGDYTVCALCFDPIGACCVPGKSVFCEVLTESTCLNMDGTFHGPFTTCEPDPCTLGACCFGAECYDGYDEYSCSIQDGVFLGYGSVCGKFSCDSSAGGDPPQIGDYLIALAGVCFANLVPEGACCLSGVCAELTEFECDAFGGDYQGDGSTCGIIVCPQPDGACCFDDGSCAILESGACLAAGGLPQGAGGDCSPNLCPQPVEACCFDDGLCAGLMPSTCLAFGGLPQGPATGCLPNPCTLPPMGACCFDGGACGVLTRIDCLDLGGLPQGIGTTCNPNDCPGAKGACCFDEGSCAVIPPDLCLSLGGLPQGAGTVCNPCGPPAGACCLNDGSCLSLPVDACAGLGGDHQGPGVPCASVVCPAPPPPAIDCCEEDEDIATLLMRYTGESCTATNHSQDGDDVECDDFGPLPNPAWIIATDEDGPDPDDDTWFEGFVSVGQPFLLSAKAGQDDDLDEETKLLIYDGPGGTLRQRVIFRTDCEAPLLTGDQFGSALLVGCEELVVVAQDCNANDVDDAQEIAGDPSMDCDDNAVLDECESNGGTSSSDCDGNGVSDACEIVTGQASDNDANGVPDKCQCPADLTGDLIVNVLDVVEVIEAWGTADPAADVTGEGFVDIADLVALITAWGKCG